MRFQTNINLFLVYRYNFESRKQKKLLLSSKKAHKRLHL
ncbi:hypothetical protein HMPREF9012_0441 [Bacteroidetes bacterium oral taxon 272 str. F0290]|nr:hypothetical protein HMPREF9012_0441 [Bacteroidetes bacterium oral taxon 272 str. F0290]